MPLTVHDYPRRTNLYVNFAQTVIHEHTPADFTDLKKSMCGNTIPAIHLRPALHSAFPDYEKPLKPELRPIHV
ncbi:hypothetical protein AYO43_00735 [Nitrospira sp. SCGC AG-212-E16]|nr:hypothetical protein AYO43_00735 [Nitrospira sp. SCGC AG-212-E16]